MTQLVWDAVGARRFEMGVDRGVLYLPDGSAVPWNGLTSIAEDLGREVKSYYIDGIKYLDHYVAGAYSAKLQAFTYPDELEELTGTKAYVPGVFLHDQRPRQFHLSYRTKAGNDIDPDLGYRIHIVYNILATPSTTTFSTVNNSPSAGEFEWTLNGVPPQMFGARPTNHISVRSELLDPELLATLEELLYGSSTVDPALPSLVDLLQLMGASA